MKYQLIVLGQTKNQFERELTAELRARLEELGLNADQEFEAVHAPEKGAIAWDGLPVTVWFGGTSPASPEELALLEKVLKENLPVFPVVEDTTRFKELVPEPRSRRISCASSISHVRSARRLFRTDETTVWKWRASFSTHSAGGVTGSFGM
jgi:hypothetical protein